MIALVFCGDLKYCPYIKRYIERIEKASAEYCVYFWNRGGLTLSLPKNYYCYDFASALSKNKVDKLFDFVKFRTWLLHKLRQDKPSKIIALSTLTGVILGERLYSNKGSYIFDIRDYSYENIGPFYHIEKELIKNSFFTAISSAGFKAFLPEHDYVIAHNFNRCDIVEGKKYERAKAKISFVWNGVVRFFEFQKMYLDALRNDERFEIVYYGDGPELELFRNYCKTHGFINVRFTGAYDNKDKEMLLSDAAVLNNCYGDNRQAGNKVKYAVSNRFYDGMIYHIPQLVEPEGYKTEWATKAGIGVGIAADSSFADKLYKYYKSIDATRFDAACNNALKTVLLEDDRYIAKIDSFINSDCMAEKVR